MRQLTVTRMEEFGFESKLKVDNTWNNYLRKLGREMTRDELTN